MSKNKVSLSVVPVMIVLIFILTIVPFDIPSSRKNIFEFDKAANEGYIAFIVNEYKDGENIPDDDDVQECDGSGFITHGDGHKTPCPGCKNCEKNEAKVSDINKPLEDFVDIMEASPLDREVKDPEIIIAPDPVITIEEDSKQILYFGASWCSFCVRFMGNEVPRLKSKGLIVHDEDYADIRTIDVDRSPSMVERYKQTRVVPEFVKLVNGKIKESKTGYMSASQVQRWLDE